MFRRPGEQKVVEELDKDLYPCPSENNSATPGLGLSADSLRFNSLPMDLDPMDWTKWDDLSMDFELDAGVGGQSIYY